MRDPFTNPFAEVDTDRRAIWDMLVDRDIAAFLAADWSMVEEDFVTIGFFALDACGKPDPDDWKLGFPDLAHYRDEWLRQAKDFARGIYEDDPRQAIFSATTLEEVEISGPSALVRKKFDGGIKRADGGFDAMNWQTLYYCRFEEGRWKIAGFTGYLPFPFPA
ncbi:hypothetical protein FJU08_20320 [Martelella alba]|uniref:SnoaL-like domain-containing protein n=1 Tax=Martelella alba TaxID=2590451 RepID=A0A506U2Y5_9HYPH|nr:hypothetical protein [Martelella alba]TPW27355.1 hypothetical protein FJU08_20320 [Martelella alba]